MGIRGSLQLPRSSFCYFSGNNVIWKFEVRNSKGELLILLCRIQGGVTKRVLVGLFEFSPLVLSLFPAHVRSHVPFLPAFCAIKIIITAETFHRCVVLAYNAPAINLFIRILLHKPFGRLVYWYESWCRRETKVIGYPETS